MELETFLMVGKEWKWKEKQKNNDLFGKLKQFYMEKTLYISINLNRA